jgi:hypothetical protein
LRVNVYGEELTSRVEVVHKTVKDPDGEEYVFYGLRFWLRFPNQPWWVHRKTEGWDDDDSSAVTFWAESLGRIQDMLFDAMQTAQEARPRDDDPEEDFGDAVTSRTTTPGTTWVSEPVMTWRSVDTFTVEAGSSDDDA